MSEGENIAMLMSMGFDADAAKTALTVSNGNIEMAANYLLTQPSSSSSSGGGATAAAAAVVETIQGTTSQYTAGEHGRSACTCMALVAAEQFLKSSQTTKTKISEEFLTQMVTNGVSAYQAFIQKNSSSAGGGGGGVEHTSVEDIFDKDPSLFPTLSASYNKNNIQQGVLSNDIHHPMGLQMQLSGLYSNNDSASWTCVILTKTPETVLVCLPPIHNNNEASSARDQQLFYLVDSHPRPQFGTEQAYCRIHDSLESLCQQSLNAIFPVTDLGSDVPEMMAIMYNSFDLYPFTSSATPDAGISDQM